MSGTAAMGIEPTVILEIGGRAVDIDASVAPIVKALNDVGLTTIACCSGHGHRPANIALRDGRELIIARNFDEARRIDALFTKGANGEELRLTGEGLRKLRKTTGLRAVDLAAALEISPSHLSRIERGRKPLARWIELATRFVCTQGPVNA